MKFFRFLRILITSILVVFLLAVGFLALFTYTAESVVLTSTYFEKDLLYSGTYHQVHEYVMDAYVSTSMEHGEHSSLEYSIIESIPPITFSYIASDYLSDWMRYLLAEVPEDEIPVLNLETYESEIYDSAIALARNDEFTTELAKQHLESEGKNPDSYSQAEIDELIEEQELIELYYESVGQAFTDTSSLYYQTAMLNNPIAILKFAAPQLSDDELLSQIKSYHGIIARYKSYANWVYIGIIACLGLILLLWINKLSIGLLIDGILIALAGIPLFVVSMSERIFIRFVLFLNNYLPAWMPDINQFEFYNNLAVKPLINRMMIVSGITVAAGLMITLFSVISFPKRKKKRIRPDIVISQSS